MPDISMCVARSCPKYKDCYRAQAMPNRDWQAYSSFEYTEIGCDNFVQILPTDILKPKSKRSK